MIEMELKPDVGCYIVLIDNHCKSDNLQDAIGFFDENIDSDLEPDTVTYTARMCGYYRQGNVNRAVTLVNEMSFRGIQPDAITMSALHHRILRAKKSQFRH
ncbi:hypothetical protein U1Q18_027730 [Sarracenia purpurea var. burkii]